MIIRKNRIKNLINNNRKSVLILIDAVMIVVSFFGAFLLRFDLSLPAEYLNSLIYLLPILLFSQIAFFNFFGFYDVIWRFTSLWDMLNIIRGVTTANVIGLLSINIFPNIIITSRSVLLIFFILN